jgi:hypothetical protein
MALIPPTERRFIAPSPEEHARRSAEAAAYRAKLDALRAALEPAKRLVLESGPLLRDLEAAVECVCSCHPRPASPELHDGGLTCPCQLTTAEREASWDELFETLDDGFEAEQEAEERAIAAFRAEVERLGVTADVVVPAAPLVISGVCDGRAFYLRERHGTWRVTIASDDDPLADPWGSPIDDVTIDIASGHERELDDDAGFRSSAVTLRVAVSAVRSALRRDTCQHETPDIDAHRYCRFCGVPLDDADRWRWSARPEQR